MRQGDLAVRLLAKIRLHQLHYYKENYCCLLPVVRVVQVVLVDRLVLLNLVILSNQQYLVIQDYPKILYVYLWQKQCIYLPDYQVNRVVLLGLVRHTRLFHLENQFVR